MIPEQYWKLLAHWSWLIVLFMLLGIFAVNFVYLHDRFYTFESVIALEVVHVNRPDGATSSNVADRQEEASRLARELEGSWLANSLQDELTLQGIYMGQSSFSVEVQGPKALGRSQTDVRPAVINVSVRHPNRGSLQDIARVASQVYSQYAIERQTLFLNKREQLLRTNVEQLELDLRDALEQQRDALISEQDRVQNTLADLLEAHNNVLGQLPELLDDFRRQVELASNGRAADPRSINGPINSLRAEIELLQTEWLEQIIPSLEVLYAIKAQPDFQIALSKKEVLQPAFKQSFETLRIFEYNADARVVSFLDEGTTISRVSTLDIRRPYALLFGAISGLVSGWVLANLGEYLLIIRANRMKARRDPLQQSEFSV